MMTQAILSSSTTYNFGMYSTRRIHFLNAGTYNVSFNLNLPVIDASDIPTPFEHIWYFRSNSSGTKTI